MEGSRKQTQRRGGKVSTGNTETERGEASNSPGIKRKADTRKRAVKPEQTQLSKLTWPTFL